MTSRTLVLLRHAKAESPAGKADLDRRLTGRGHADAAAAGVWLAAQGYVPELVLCSPAQRTRDTWDDVAPALAGPRVVRFEPVLYGATVDEFLELIVTVGAEVSMLLVVGHNPGLSQLSLGLDDTGDPQGLHTAGIAVHRFDGDWADCAPDAAPLAASHLPRA